MSTSVEQAPAKTTTPATTTATSSTSTSSSTATSNSEAQAAAGLSGEVPPSTSDGDLLATLPTLGEVGTVVLDAMPLQSALPVALQLMSIDWVAEWVGALAPGDVAAAGPSAVKGVLDALFPVGMGVEVTLQAELALAIGKLAPGALAAFKRESEGWQLTVSGLIGGTAGLETTDTLSVGGAGADKAGGGAGATLQGAVQVTFSTCVGDTTMLAEFARLGALAMTSLMGGVPAFALVMLTDPAGKMIASGEFGGGTEAWGGSSTVGVSTDGTMGEAELDLAPALASGGIGLKGSIKAGGGVDEGRVYGFAEGGYTLTGGGTEALEGEADTTSRLRVEAWAPPTQGAPPSSLDHVNEVRVTYVDTTEKEGSERSLTGDRWAQVFDLAYGGADCEEAGATVGDLRIAREHKVEDPAQLVELLPEGVVPQEFELDLAAFEASMEFRDSVEVLVVEEAARLAAPEGADTDLVRDVQRSMAAARLGEHFEAEGFEPSETDAVLLTRATITARGKAIGGLSACGTGADAGITTTREIDLLPQATVEPELAAELLTA